jgi:hypothetical protein
MANKNKLALAQVIDMIDPDTEFGFGWEGNEDALLCEEVFKKGDFYKIVPDFLKAPVAEIAVYECDEECECDTRINSGGVKGNKILYFYVEYVED